MITRPSLHQHQHLTTLELLSALGVLLFTVWITLVRSRSLPLPVGKDAPLTQFSEERAREHLTHLLNLGPHRVVGSLENEEMAPKLIIEKAQAIQKLTGAKIEIERQEGSGSFSLDFLGGFTSVYQGVQNVLIMLHSKKHPPQEGVLMISAHYDSPVGTKGASDNAANVANMIEILQVLATDHENLPRSVLFMFTGAEETILQGSHMFSISGHPWVNYVKAFINIEAAGSGGRELMFQATSNAMALAWARAAPFPHGSIIGQEVFQSGIIPSDTDFRMYVDKLKIPGMDLANVENGQNYHTSLDIPENIEPGAMQRYGENVLETARELLKDEDFWRQDSNSDSNGLLIFFDVLGLFVLVITSMTSLLFLLAGVVVLYLFFTAVFALDSEGDESERSARYLAVKKVVQMLARCLTYPLLTAIFVHFISPLSYYSRPWIVVFLYISPALYGVASCMTNVRDIEIKRPSQVRKELLSFASAVGFWTLVTLILLVKGKGSIYIAYCWAVFPPLFRLAFSKRNHYSLPNFLKDDKARLHLIENKNASWVGAIVGSIIPILLTAPLLLVVLKFFIPITGRSGTRVPGDIIVSLVCGFCTFLVSLVPSSILQLLPAKTGLALRRLLFYAWAFGVLLSVFFRIIYGPGKASFSAEYPKRVYAIHVDAPTENYIWIIDADSSLSHSLVQHVYETDPFFALSDVETIDCDSTGSVYCGAPWYLPFKSEVPQSLKIPSKTRLVTDDNECTMELMKEEKLPESGLRRLHFNFKSCERANIFFHDQQHGGPVAWSFDAPLSPTAGSLYILVANGKNTRSITSFWVDVPGKLDMAWACHFLDPKNEKSEELERFDKALPDWSTPVSFNSVWKEAVF